MQRREEQHDRQRHPFQATAAEDMAPEQLSVWPLLSSPNEDMLEVAEDIYYGQYQLAPSTFLHWCLDLLMQDLHDDLDQRLLKAGFCIATSSGMF